jgi:hypothetical protein
MAQHDYDIANQTFPSFRSDLNSVLEAINTSNSGTSRPTSAVAGTIWLDTTSATTPTLKFYDGSDDISLATLDYTANTVNWIDSTVIFDIVNDTTPQLGGNLDVNGNSLVSTSNGNITFTPDGTGKVVISGLNYPTSDGTADQVLTTDGSGNLSFSDISGGTSWQSSIKTSAFTAVAGEGYWINTTSGAVTMTLPASASVGDTIEFSDYAGTWASNAVTINTNSLNFQGNTSPNPEYNTNNQSVRIVYSGATKGWIPTSDDDVTLETPQPPYSVDFLVVAGGGGAGGKDGGNNASAAGGAGGYRNSFSTESSGGGGSSETNLTFNNGTLYTITVGAGGSGGIGFEVDGTNGVNSSLSGSDITTITSSGGGGGGAANGNSGLSGGSGGGGCSSGGSGSGTSNQGYAGGGANGSSWSGSGGGGAGGTGATSSGADTSSNGGNGGNGLASSITGSSTSRGGGGGGGSYSGTAGTGGTGGGGNGSNSTDGNAGTVNTGGGGGGAGGSGSSTTGGTGGSGVVILRMPTASYSGTTSGSPTVTTDGTDTILTFTGSGSYTG